MTRRLQAGILLLLVFTFSARGAQFWLGFEDPSLHLRSVAAAFYKESGVVFIGDSDRSLGHTMSGFEALPDNGSAYLSIGRSKNGFRFQDNRPFKLEQLDVAEYSTVFASPQTVTFKGYKADGSFVTFLFVTDGIMDGRGGFKDFETVKLPPTFSDLLRVEFEFAYPSASPTIDNVLITAEPALPTVPWGSYTYSYNTVWDANAFAHVTTLTGASRQKDLVSSFWNGGFLNGNYVIQRFDFEAPTSQIKLRTRLDTFSLPEGYGFASFWVSGDDIEWVKILDAPKPSNGTAATYTFNGLLPANVLGYRTLYTWVVFYVQFNDNTWNADRLIFSSWGKANVHASTPVFSVDAVLTKTVPPTSEPTPTSTPTPVSTPKPPDGPDVRALVLKYKKQLAVLNKRLKTAQRFSKQKQARELRWKIKNVKQQLKKAQQDASTDQQMPSPRSKKSTKREA